MKALKFFIPFFIILFCWSCNNDAVEQPLSDEQITLNLSENENNDPELLIGEWNIVEFAYTTDGKKILDVTNIPIDPDYDLEWIASQNGISIDEAIDILKPKLEIPNPPNTPPEDEWIYSNGVNQVENADVLWRLHACNSSTWICSLYGNLIRLKANGSTMKYCPNSAESDIMFALSNAYSFFIKSNELIIYFTGNEKLDTIQKKEFKIIKNHNLLILKKR